MPTPALRCKGSRRLSVLTTRVTRTASTRAQAPLRTSTNVSSRNPGLMPEPSSVTPASRAVWSSSSASCGEVSRGWTSSSQVDTAFHRCCAMVASCGATWISREPVACTTTPLPSPPANASSTLSVTTTSEPEPSPRISPSFWPVFCGSMSTAPTMVRSVRVSSLAPIRTPIGPRPNSTTGVVIGRRVLPFAWQ